MLVQLPEPLDPDSKDQKIAAEYCDQLGRPRNIAELTKERLRRAGKAISSETPMVTCDLGFRVFKLASSNIKTWDAEFDNVEAKLFDSADNIKLDRSDTELLYELLLKIGLDLAVTIEKREIQGNTLYVVGTGALVICLAAPVTLELVDGIAALKKELQPEVMRVVFKDSSFPDDVVKTNAVQILRRAGIEDIKSL